MLFFRMRLQGEQMMWCLLSKIFATNSPNNGGWHLPAGSENSVSVPFDFMAGRLEFNFYACSVQ